LNDGDCDRRTYAVEQPNDNDVGSIFIRPTTQD